MKLFKKACLFLGCAVISSVCMAIPTLEWPLPGLPDTWIITSVPGEHWQNQYCGSNRQLHTAIDISAPIGTKVESAYAGTIAVVVIYNNNPSDERNFVTVSHSSWTSTYHHIKPVVSYGQSVSMGQKIGEVNNHSGGSHLHFGVRNTSYSNIANRGRLPENTSCGGDPAYPEYFLDPSNLNYYW